MRRIPLPGFFLVLTGLFAGWYVVFQTDVLDFWWRMFLTTLVFSLVVILLGGKRNVVPNRYEPPLIIYSALIAYLVFVIGYLISLLIPAFHNDVVSVYELSTGQSVVKVTILLLFIAFFEEIIWRGFIAEFLLQKMDVLPAVLISSILYSIVHVFTGNIALIVGAFVLGLILSFLYVVTGKVSTPAFSHALWSLLIFVLLPLRGG
ncbi:CPBP family intramembrane glutamic endopeptidase [Thermotoga sp. SG1]|uniref:CPBP family intramembrane glutamic endopeptidase n=1 Tax=Thermotoga sp. SG1 TaxID=126739 RepID=UPI000C76AC27|nr:type II CAAX endopeptidase family protein [Thermotoga sp. SG1]PLV55763.1 abortive phage infection protein [Thermotoga sp. SG1]